MAAHEQGPEQQESGTNTPQELRDELTALDAKVDRLEKIDVQHLTELLSSFRRNHEKIEEWDVQYRAGKLDPDQQKIFEQVKHDFFDLYHDLIRFTRLRDFWRDRGEWMNENQRDQLQREIGTIQLALHNSSLIDDLGKQSGMHTYESQLLGRHIEPYERYVKFVREHPGHIKFGEALYPGHSEEYRDIDIEELDSPVMTMIPYAMRKEADTCARELYRTYCEHCGLDPKKQVEFSPDKISGYYGEVEVPRVETSDMTWRARVYTELKSGEGLVVTDRKTKEKYYQSPYITALHEMGHAERTKVFQMYTPETTPPYAVREIAQVIDQIINQDEVYKKAKGMPLDSVAEYPKKLPSDIGSGVPLGELANVFRALKGKFGTIEDALMSQEGQKFVHRFYSESGQ